MESDGDPTGEAAYTSPDRSRSRSQKRPLWITVAVLLTGSLALWVSSTMAWSAEYRDAGVRGMVIETRSGTEHSAVIVPIALLALAAIAGVIAAGDFMRRFLGIVLAAAGAVVCWQALRDVSAAQLVRSLDDYPSLEIIAARLCALCGGILMAATGFFIIIRAKMFSRLGKRYSASHSRRRERDKDAELWEALSHGEDPTAHR